MSAPKPKLDPALLQELGPEVVRKCERICEKWSKRSPKERARRMQEAYDLAISFVALDELEELERLGRKALAALDRAEPLLVEYRGGDTHDALEGARNVIRQAIHLRKKEDDDKHKPGPKPFAEYVEGDLMDALLPHVKQERAAEITYELVRAYGLQPRYEGARKDGGGYSPESVLRRYQQKKRREKLI